MKKIRLLIITLLSITSLVAQAELKRTSNDITVIDTETKLEWSDSGLEFKAGWGQAIASCEELILDGKEDWRLPNINELKSIIVDTQYAPTLITGNNGFKPTENGYYWSSSNKRERYYTWLVNFNDGTVKYINNGNYRTREFFRCVRGGE